MKTIFYFFLLLSISLFSCSKTDVFTDNKSKSETLEISYSESIGIKEAYTGTSPINIFPNPFVYRVCYCINGNNQNTISITISDEDGRIKRFDNVAQNGIFDFQKSHNGVYYMEVLYNGIVYRYQLIKICY